MATRQVRGSTVGSLTNLRKSLKSKGGIGGGKIKIISAEQTFAVRFLTEPDKWFGYYEHYNKTDGFFPCYEGECCTNSTDRASMKYLANVFVQEDNKVMALKIPKSLAEDLMRSCDKYTTMQDRWYEVSRVGTGMSDTKYSRDAETPTRFKLPRGAELHDLHKLMQGMVDAAEDEEEEEEETNTARKKRAASRTSGPARRSSREVLDDDEDEEEEDDDEDDDYEPPPRRRSAVAKKASAKKPASRVSSTPAKRSIKRR